MTPYIKEIVNQVQANQKQVENTIRLLNEGATIPFICRYRKDLTGNLEEEKVAAIERLDGKYRELETRKQGILKTIEEQGKLSEELKTKIQATRSSAELEDLYLPFKPKKRTRATMAREKGLEPLARIMMKQTDPDLAQAALRFLSDQVRDTEEALSGARDILAEWINEDAFVRDKLRKLYRRSASITSTVARGKEQEADKYRNYFNFEESLGRSPSHRILAMFRGEKEGFLKITVEPVEDEALQVIESNYVTGKPDAAREVKEAVKDAYKRLLKPSLENEFKQLARDKADRTAIQVFSGNLRQLLLMPPLGPKRILALDPGYKSGCKLVCIDEQGNLLHNENIYPHPPHKETKSAARKIASLAEVFNIEAIAIGNGTAGRETEHFIRKIRFKQDIQVFIVDESGASVYSTSKVAREEFPGYDVTVRGAVSIGRRLMDPLAELVKIDPKSIGVGQYQHDVNQKLLKESLTRVVESCVNKVGVNLNTASSYLLGYVSGLGPQLADNIIQYRKENGPFQSREELKNIKRLGDKAFEQSAGFLRIPNGISPLDNTAVHPESYYIVETMAETLQCSVQDIIENKALQSQVNPGDFADGHTGMLTITDIMEELAKPGLDPREKVKVFEFAKDIFKIEDLKAGMTLPGIITNITNFGAFVDIGIKQNGLIHLSNLADRFVSDPNEIVRLHQHVSVKVLDIDTERGRIQLSLIH